MTKAGWCINTFPLPENRTHQETYSPKATSKRTRYDDSTIALKRKIEKSEDSIQKLKAHTEKKTCLKSLRYNVRANIVPDEDFKQDINHIRKEAEQKLVGALTRFHYWKVERTRNKLRKTEQKMNLAKARKTENEELIKNRPRPAKDNKHKAGSENVLELANTLMQRIEKFDVLMKKVEENQNKKKNEPYPCFVSDETAKGRETQKRKVRNKKRHDRRKITKRDKNKKSANNQKYIKNLSDYEMSTDEINLLSKGLKFIPTPTMGETRIKRQLLQDFKQFERRMRLKYIFHGQEKEPHPFYVKSHWEPPVQSSVALENYLEGVKTELAEIKLSKQKQNLPHKERQAIRELKANPEINIKKADKGTTTVLMNKKDKIEEG